MNPNRRDLFLWQWSRRRGIGGSGAALRGALIGAAGGLVFALVLGLDMNSSGPRGFPWLLERISQLVLLVGVSVPAFAAPACFFAWRIFRTNEAIYHGLLQGGAAVPLQEPPPLAWSERGPAIAVAVAMLLIGALVLTAIITLG
jgi:hypothetical protein